MKGSRHNLCPIQFVPDTVCSRYNLFPIQFVSNTNCADTNCADTICADTICSRYNLCRYNLYMNRSGGAHENRTFFVPVFLKLYSQSIEDFNFILILLSFTESQSSGICRTLEQQQDQVGLSLTNMGTNTLLPFIGKEH
jgi:hypothetical protein